MDGIVQVPIAKGKKELAWYVAASIENGGNNLTPTVNMRIDKDADFVALRRYLVQWPSYGTGADHAVGLDPTLKLPAQTAVLLRDGGTRRGLGLASAYARSVILDADPDRSQAMEKGMTSAMYLKAASNFFAEISNPGAAGTAWTGDLYLVLEGYNLYPNLPPEFGKTITQYSLGDFSLASSALIAEPASGGSTIDGQYIVMTNNGDGKVLVKGMSITCVDNGGLGVDVTDKILPCLGFNVTDTTSGGKAWVRSPGLASGQTISLPALLMTYGNRRLRFCRPRLIDETGSLKVQLVFPQIPAALAYLADAHTATWPVNITVNFYGDLLPK